ncbi:ABC transporter substrate-binding protein [Streptomyces zinciresistens K42]|uniref:ABC transporter substrate-binding protein n=1 Tax=Streptomyces zinciresistens K42 TaxID=700597 RepID=G2GL96_9ACTN|nr:extracellular solute-binding protein [Streptomyces zinciresistens]EGX55710.1 ABC transporter substrate-binding protein [Streptomyces zinciresistens K42]
MRRTAALALRWVLALALLLAAAACGAPERRITIMVPWSDDEFRAFHSVVAAFEKESGITVDIQVTRDLTQQLDAAVAAGAPPDLAVLPSVAAMQAYAGSRLKALDIGTEAFVEPFRGLGMEKGKVYAVPVKADVKTLVWYGPRVDGELPRSWSALAKRPERWCLGLESGPTSGWPGADWIADLLLADGGVGAYEKWLAGGVKWDSEPVRRAWTSWRDLVGASLDGAASRPFRTATAGLTKPRPACSLSHGALSATDFGQDAVRRGTYRFTTPTPDVLQVSADFVGKFTADGDPDSAAADRLIAYLASRRGQQAWVDAPTSYALSAHKQVTRYDNSDTQRRAAAMLRSAATLCFTAADAMDPDVSAAFYRAVLDYARGAERDPTALLRSLDRVQSRMGHSPPALTERLCHTPT